MIYRRQFLKGIGLISGLAVTEATLIGRVYSFPKTITCLNRYRELSLPELMMIRERSLQSALRLWESGHGYDVLMLGQKPEFKKDWRGMFDKYNGDQPIAAEGDPLNSAKEMWATSGSASSFFCDGGILPVKGLNGQ